MRGRVYKLWILCWVLWLKSLTFNFFFWSLMILQIRRAEQDQVTRREYKNWAVCFSKESVDGKKRNIWLRLFIELQNEYDERFTWLFQRIVGPIGGEEKAFCCKWREEREKVGFLPLPHDHRGVDPPLSLSLSLLGLSSVWFQNWGEVVPYSAWSDCGFKEIDKLLVVYMYFLWAM